MAQAHQTLHQPKAPTVGVFFSPPEAHKPESFSYSQSPLRQARRPVENDSCTERLPSIRSILPPLSPPVSPATKIDQELGLHEVSSSGDKDPQLFPERSVVQPDANQPLFRPTDFSGSTYSPTIDAHVRALDAAGRERPSPTRDEYELACTFTTKLFDRLRADPAAYLAKELGYLKAYPPRFSLVATSMKRRSDADRVTKRQRAAPKATIEKIPVVKRMPRASPRDIPLDSFDAEPVQKHKRKVSRSTPVPRDDMDYRKVPDFSPPVSTMASGKNLKIDWKGHPLDLSDDPDRHMLDDQELTLASVLRLTGSQYLFAKRKIFERFVELARVGKDFNKTSAQGVCKIDVNKASKLWTAFEKVGWFDRRLFSQYLY